MSSTHGSSRIPKAGVVLDGFEVLDDCHLQTLIMLDKLEALVARLPDGLDAEARGVATDIASFFSSTARLHHEDEERHVFPLLLTGGDPDIVQAVLRLQQDHAWLEEDWMELSSHVEAVALGQPWFDLDVLRAATEVFVALARDHVALEESYIYPRARSEAQAGLRRSMGREMAARRRGDRHGKASDSVPPRSA